MSFSFHAKHPTTRPRRLRASPFIRALVAETSLSAQNLIWPIFLVEGDERVPVASMPSIVRYPIKDMAYIAETAARLKLPAVALFPLTPPEKRDETGSEAFNRDNLVCRGIAALKEANPALGVICDVALDPYTSHGHDGLLKDNVILNDETVECLTQQALVQVAAGCDVIAPSDMMDGRIGAIRHALDTNGFADRIILSYAVKYASALYAPFRDAVGSQNVLKGDKKTYQMDYANSDEALRETALDIEQGADIIMVKPAHFYADIIYRVKKQFAMPVFAYQVSGEYAMIANSASSDPKELEKIAIESLVALRRAGADSILTYFAPHIAPLL